MMRRVLMCAIAATALLAADESRAQAPLQITPQVARPPASIPGKPAKKPAPPKQTHAKPEVAKPPIAKPAAKPILKKSIEPKTAKPAPPPPAPAPSAPSAFAPEQTPLAPFAPSEKTPPQSQQAALQPQTPAQGDVAFGAFQRGHYIEAFGEAFGGRCHDALRNGMSGSPSTTR